MSSFSSTLRSSSLVRLGLGNWLLLQLGINPRSFRRLLSDSRSKLSPPTLWRKTKDLLSPFIRYPHFEDFEAATGRFMMALYLYKQPYYPCLATLAHPIGLARYFDITIFCQEPQLDFLLPFYYLCLLCYTFNIIPLASLTYVLTFFVLKNQANNSNGYQFHKYQIVGLILLTQWCGLIYLRRRNILAFLQRLFSSSSSSSPSTTTSSPSPPSTVDDQSENSLLFRLSQEAIAAVYVTTALTKHIKSHGLWFTNAAYFTLNLLAVNEREYYNYGEVAEDFVSNVLGSFLAQHPLIAKWFFGSAFWLELIVPLFLYNRTAAALGGATLIFMHFTITLTMRLNFSSHEWALVAYFISPLYWIHWIWVSLLQYFDCRAAPEDSSSSSSSSSSPSSSSSSSSSSLTDNDSTSAKAASLLPSPAIHHKEHKEAGSTTFQKIPFKSMIVLVIVCLYMKDTFPFSDFPMYGIPVQNAYYFHIQDHSGNPVFALQNFRITAAQMKKIFFTTCTKLYGKEFSKNDDALKHCGNTSIAFYDTTVLPEAREKLDSLKPWKLYMTHLQLKNGGLVRNTKEIGYLPVGNSNSRDKQSKTTGKTGKEESSEVEVPPEELANEEVNEESE